MHSRTQSGFSMLIGYARVSTRQQSLGRQIAALEAAGCDLYFKEQVSGKTTRNRPQLARALARLKKGDVFVVAEWDRATRSMMDGVNLMLQIHAKGATISVLDKPSLDLSTPIGRGVLGLLSSIYEDERARIVERARQGIAHAKRNKVKFGRKPKLSATDAARALEMIRDGVSYRRIGVAFGVHHVTISRLARHP